jgi:hypothetical protein
VSAFTPGDVVTGTGLRSGHIMAQPLDSHTIQAMCGIALWASPSGGGVWLAPAGTRICTGCRTKASRRITYRQFPDAVDRACFGERFVPTHVPEAVAP